MAKFKAKQIVEWTHLYTGLAAAPLLLLLGLTGTLLVFEYPLDHLLNARMSYVSPPSSGVRPLPLQALIESVRSASPTASQAAEKRLRFG
jgi:uncharacterized iron-regulated membrane protein